MTETRAELGHNMPPAYDVDALEALKQRARQFADAAAEWKSLGEIQDDAQAERLNAFVAGAEAVGRDLETQRKADKAPWIAGGKAVDDAFKTVSGGLQLAIGAAKALRTAWLKKERDRLRREERARADAAREAAEAAEAKRAQAQARDDMIGEAEAGEEAQAAAREVGRAEAAADRAKPRLATPGGRTVALRKQRRARVQNSAVAFMQFKDHPDVVAVLEKLANAQLRAGSEGVPGFVIEETEVAA